MRWLIIKNIFLLLFFLLLVSCSNNVPVQKSNLTAGMIKSKVVKGKTSQNDILSIFGAPNLITKNKSDNEVWSYNKMSVEESSRNGYASLLLIGKSSALNSKTTSSFDWIISFTDEGIVKDYSIISSSY